MQRDEVIHLQVRPKSIGDPFSYILEVARDKRVLNVGASGGVEHYLPAHREAWLHARLGAVAAELVGMDIDSDSIRYAANYGVGIEHGDCETYRFARPFDLIVMSDVIEHVNAPLRAIDNLVHQLAPCGRLLVTTPNPTHYGLVGRAWSGRGLSVYYDHVMSFLPEHFQVICNRLGLRMTEVIFFSHFDARSLPNRLKSLLARGVGRMLPRSHSSFLVAIELPQCGGGKSDPRCQDS